MFAFDGYPRTGAVDVAARSGELTAAARSTCGEIVRSCT